MSIYCRPRGKPRQTASATRQEYSFSSLDMVGEASAARMMKMKNDKKNDADSFVDTDATTTINPARDLNDAAEKDEETEKGLFFANSLGVIITKARSRGLCETPFRTHPPPIIIGRVL